MSAGQDLHELAESVAAFRKTLDELKSVYEDARRNGADLPLYGNLVLQPAVRFGGIEYVSVARATGSGMPSE